MDNRMEKHSVKRAPNTGFSKAREESLDSSPVSDELPRAVLRQNSYVLLDGEWDFEYDEGNRGLTENWFLSHRYGQTVNWPGVSRSILVR